MAGAGEGPQCSDEPAPSPGSSRERRPVGDASRGYTDSEILGLRMLRAVHVQVEICIWGPRTPAHMQIECSAAGEVPFPRQKLSRNFLKQTESLMGRRRAAVWTQVPAA